MMNMKNYTTKDFYLCVLLMCKGFKFLSSRKEENGVHFTLEIHDEKLHQKVIDDFINFNALVNMGKMVKVQAFLRRELDKYKSK